MGYKLIMSHASCYVIGISSWYDSSCLHIDYHVIISSSLMCHDHSLVYWGGNCGKIVTHPNPNRRTFLISGAEENSRHAFNPWFVFSCSSCTTDSRTWKDSWINNNDTGNIFKISKQSHQSLKSWK